MTMPSLVVARSRSPYRTVVPALLLVMCAMPTAAIALDRSAGVSFAEPVSGRKVTEYTAELPLGPSQRRPFAIPVDCPAVLEAISQGSAYRQSILDRRIWQKVEGDCRYHRFLHQHPLQGIKDYVSDYDFKNARLSDLPIDPNCSADTPAGSACGRVADQAFGILRHPPPGAAQRGAADDAGEETPCRLEDGLFRGYLYTDDQGIRCVAVTDAPSLRLIAVDFADINGDHVLDAVLRFVPLGPGAVRSPLMLPLTRFSDDEPFRVPPGTRLPSPPERP
jgi:hypothetical protein